MRLGRLKLTELLKFVVACGIGYTLRVLIESSNYKYSSALPGQDLSLVNSVNDQESVEHMKRRLCGDIHEQFKIPYKPGHENETIEYRFFTQDTLFDVHRSVPRIVMKKYQSSDVMQLLHEVFPLLNAEGGYRYEIDGLRGGYERIDPLRGKEYIVNLNLSKRKRSGKSPELVQLRLVRPFTSLYVTSRVHYLQAGREPVYLIVPAPFELKEVMFDWAKDLVSRVFPYAKNLQVTLVVFNPGNDEPAKVNALHARLKELDAAHPGLHLSHNLVLSQHPFSPAFAKQLAITPLPQDSQLLLADLFVRVTSEFIDRCRSALQTPKPEADASEPSDAPILSVVPFSLYSRKFAPRGTAGDDNGSPWDGVDLSVGGIAQSTGYWDHGSHEVYCLRKSAFERAGGFAPLRTEAQLTAATGADANRRLYANAVRTAGIDLVRSADPGVFLNHHALDCARYERFRYMTGAECHARLERSLGSRSALAGRFLAGSGGPAKPPQPPPQPAAAAGAAPSG